MYRTVKKFFSFPVVTLVALIAKVETNPNLYAIDGVGRANSVQGVFSLTLPGRVGYQCSAHYRRLNKVFVFRKSIVLIVTYTYGSIRWEFTFHLSLDVSML
jgi:hypothetical protein